MTKCQKDRTSGTFLKTGLFKDIKNDADTLMLMHCIVAKKWDPGILDPSRFSGQIRKVEARLGKLAKIRKVETD